MRRRDFVTLLGAAAAAWPLAALGQQAALPVVAFVSGRSEVGSAAYGAAFRKGLGDQSSTSATYKVAAKQHGLAKSTPPTGTGSILCRLVRQST
jgi:hypothetical protein